MNSNDLEQLIAQLRDTLATDPDAPNLIAIALSLSKLTLKFCSLPETVEVFRSFVRTVEAKGILEVGTADKIEPDTLTEASIMLIVLADLLHLGKVAENDNELRTPVPGNVPAAYRRVRPDGSEENRSRTGT